MLQNLERESYYLGNLIGVPLFLHWSALLLVWSAWNLSGGGGGVQSIILVLISLVLGILLHEFGHGLMARALGAFGITITLWAFGGLCRSSRDPSRVGREIAIVAAGPLVSLGLWLGASFTLGYLRIHAPGLIVAEGGYTLLAEFLAIFSVINLLLLLFNVLPIYPLDGGQLTFHVFRLVFRDVRVAAQLSLTLAVIGALAYFCYATGLFTAMQGADPVRVWLGHLGQDLFGTALLAILLGFLLRNAFLSLS